MRQRLSLRFIFDDFSLIESQVLPEYDGDATPLMRAFSYLSFMPRVLPPWNPSFTCWPSYQYYALSVSLKVPDVAVKNTRWMRACTYLGLTPRLLAAWKSAATWAWNQNYSLMRANCYLGYLPDYSLDGQLWIPEEVEGKITPFMSISPTWFSLIEYNLLENLVVPGSDRRLLSSWDSFATCDSGSKLLPLW